ncbi:MAG: hypothetical protein VXZ82_07315 [Planctomycetota bacterium]|nr:hypothetical protein [Planctomycetota bacterium]
MRLTLRTLLAYRDGVLSPLDAEDISRRIHQSEDAANLLKRIEALAAQPEKASATVVGKGLGGDPNSLAEYLDDILASESIPELEKTCLQSNELLAELAGCHSLLSSAMNKRVDVPETLRETALKLGSAEQRKNIEAELKKRRKNYRDAGTQPTNKEESQKSEIVVQSPMLASSGDSIKEEGLDLEGASLAQEVPEYLQGSSEANWKLPVAICAVFTLLAVLLWQALGPVDSVLEMFASKEQKPTPELVDKEVGASSEPTQGDQPRDTTSPDSAPSDARGSTVDAAKPAKSPRTPASNETANIETPRQGVSPEKALPAYDPPKDTADKVAADNGDSSPSPTPTEPPADAALIWGGNKQSSQGVLLVRADGKRLEQSRYGAGILDGQEFVLAPFSHLNLVGQDVNWEIVGPMLGEASKSGLNLKLGRSLLSAAQPGAEVELESALGKVKIKFVDGNSKAAVEMAFRRSKHGSLFETDVLRPVFLVTAVDGTLEVTESDSGVMYNLGFTKGIAIIGDSQGKREVKNYQLHQIPDWYRMSLPRAIDREALLELEQDLVLDPTRNEKTLQQVLQRLTKSRRPEEAALAIQLLMLQGDWSGLAHPRCLANPQMSIHWQNIIDLLGPAIALNPIKAKQLEPALVNAFPDGKLVYKQLFGLDEKSVTGNRAGMSELIEQLKSNRLANRATAFLELYRLTGEKHSFQPQEPNHASVLTWRREFSANRLPLLDPQALVWEAEKPQ